MKYFITIWFLLYPFINKAQDSVKCILPDEYQTVFAAGLAGEVYKSMPGLRGAEYYIADYLLGNIFLENGEVAYNYWLKYNGRIDGLLLNPAGQSYEILLDKFFVKGFSLKVGNPDKYLIFNKINIKEILYIDSIQVYAQELYHGKFSLYSYRKFAFKEENNEIIDGKMIAKKTYVPSFTYYFKLPTNKTIGFKSFKKRSLYKLFPQNKDVMRKIFKEKRQRRFKKEEDLIRITEILNPMFN